MSPDAPAGSDGAAAAGAPRTTASAADPADRSNRRSEGPVFFAQLVGGILHQWSVVEVDAEGVPGARGARCLVFSRPDCIRRIWEYPANWRTLNDAQLAALSWHR